MKKAQELTDRIWSNIESTLVERMTELRTKRVATERFVALTKRQKILDDLLSAYRFQRAVEDVIPRLADICEMHAFKTILWDTPIDVEVTECTFQPAMKQLPQLIDKWRDEKDAELLNLMDPTFTLENDRRKLDLATTLFGCTRGCRNAIVYPRILFHQCATDYDNTSSQYAELDETVRLIWQLSNCQPALRSGYMHRFRLTDGQAKSKFGVQILLFRRAGSFIHGLEDCG